jgi:predicted TIM-barrel fold metal-dependent hydrolase
MLEPSVVDAHVHFWDPDRMRYPWLDGQPVRRRVFRPDDIRSEAVQVAGPPSITGSGNLFRPYLEHALQSFGPDRCMFGSDWPVATMSVTTTAGSNTSSRP